MRCWNPAHSEPSGSPLNGPPARYAVKDGRTGILMLLCLGCMETSKDMGTPEEDMLRIPYKPGKEPAA